MLIVNTANSTQNQLFRDDNGRFELRSCIFGFHFFPTERECRAGKSDRQADSPLMVDVTPHLVAAREG